MINIQSLCAQVYTEKQSRHRFAQMTLGLDLQSSFGGNTKYIDAFGIKQSQDLPTTVVPRFLIGGTHFWGHADFYIAIPLYSPTIENENQEIQSLSGVETVFKYYPLRIEHGKLRPYLGTSIAPFYYEHENKNLAFSNGPELNYTSFPLLAGITYNSNQHVIEAGLTWNYSNKRSYYISRDQIETINMSPLYASVSYKFMFDTTIGAEKDWESGRTAEITSILADKKSLNGFFLGAGMSSAFWLRRSSYNIQNRPYIEKYNTAILPEFSLGYYLHKPDLNFGLAYRSYGSSSNSYGTIQNLNRKSLLFEATKFVFDYHGFVPFIGPNISYEKLSFTEAFEGQESINKAENKFAYGLTFGWDIRPNRIGNWILRTNLRWYPNLYLEVEPESKISFDNLEFNFIQLIIYPNRMKKK